MFETENPWATDGLAGEAPVSTRTRGITLTLIRMVERASTPIALLAG